MANWSRLLIEGVIMGIIVLVLGFIIDFFTRPFLKGDMPRICERWSTHWAYAVNLFLVGFIGHIGFELAGFNKWYCRHGHACLELNK